MEEECNQLLQKLKSFYLKLLLLFVVVIMIGVFFMSRLHQLSMKEPIFQPMIVPIVMDRIRSMHEELDHHLMETNYLVKKIMQDDLSAKSSRFYVPRPICSPNNPSLCNLTSEMDQYLQGNYQMKRSLRCFEGECEMLSPFEPSLWTFQLHTSFIKEAYIWYEDPIDGTFNGLVTPLIDPQLTFSTVNFQSHGKLEKSKGDLAIFARSFNNSGFNYSIALHYDPLELQAQGIKIADNLDLIGNASKLYCSQGVQTLTIKEENFSLITYYICLQDPVSASSKPSYKLLVLLPFLMISLIFIFQEQEIKRWCEKTFGIVTVVKNLFQFNICELFSGRKIQKSLVLQKGVSSEFFQVLSDLVDESMEEMRNQTLKEKRKEGFIFQNKIQKIIEKFQLECRQIFEEKNREIINNKFFIHSSINDISENESRKIKEYFLKTKELGLLHPFFNFAYLSLLKDPQIYDTILSEDRSPLPDQIIKLFRSINHMVRSSDVRKAFRFTQQISQETQEELQLRIQTNLLQKYLQILKDLDIHNFYAKGLGLQKELASLSQKIQNARYLLTKHNKNMRNFKK